MRCPRCQHGDDKVIDSRPSQEGESIRRRRECERCAHRFTTYERIESEMPLVVKRDGTRAPYSRDNILGGVRKACEKRPIASDRIAALVDDVERAVLDRGEPEVPSTFIGERVMERLRELDDVAYVRFASVYRSFRDAEDFLTELKHFLDKSR
ncbi:MAG: transcriptional regulator NrdR [Myxococcota bacterium]